jgi:crotonobetainyl-CoA:carnitine CoA-transferase CaiB-like acyl-CoA transferase
VRDVLQTWTSKRTVDEVLIALHAARVPAGRIKTSRDLQDEDSVDDSCWLEVGDGLGGEVRLAGNPLGSAILEPTVDRIGGHSRQLLNQLGYAPGEIQAMITRNIVRAD